MKTFRLLHQSVLLAAVVASLSLGAAPLDKLPDLDLSNPTSSEIQSILGVQNTAGSLKSVVGNAMAAYGGTDVASLERSIDTLVTALNKGGKPNELFGNLIPKMRLDRYNVEVPLPDRAFQESYLRRRIMETMFRKSGVLWKEHRSKAALYARAAILLAGQEDFIFGTGFLTYLHRNFKQFIELAQVTPDQTDRLRKLLDRINTHRSLIEESLLPADFARDEILKQKAGEAVLNTLLDPALAYYDDAERMATQFEDRGEEFTVIQQLWGLRNLGTSLHSRRIVDAVDTLLGDWKHSAESSLVRLWIQQAEDFQGAAPTRPTLMGFDRDDIAKLLMRLKAPPKRSRILDSGDHTLQKLPRGH